MLEAEGVQTISLNPVTVPSTVRALQRALVGREGALPSSKLRAVAEAARGDLSTALHTLWFCLAGPGGEPGAAREPDRPRRAPKRGRSASEPSGASPPAYDPGGRDAALGTFHALGKVLYCKRDEDTGRLSFDPEAVVASCDLGPGELWHVTCRLSHWQDRWTCIVKGALHVLVCKSTT